MGIIRVCTHNTATLNSAANTPDNIQVNMYITTHTHTSMVQKYL